MNCVGGGVVVMVALYYSDFEKDELLHGLGRINLRTESSLSLTVLAFDYDEHCVNLFYLFTLSNPNYLCLCTLSICLPVNT
jgi:hypothetical protein